MELGLFSMSLAVSDLEASSAFYAKLGFEEMAGDGEHYLIMVNNGSVVGLFQDMFERNILTFNPGWDQPSRADVVEEMLPYVEREVANGLPLNSISRHMLGLFAGQPGARAWRRYISEHAHREGAGSEVLVNALNAMPAAA